MPSSLNDFSEEAEDEEGNKLPNFPVNPEMIIKPNLNKFVFLKMTKKIGDVEFEDDAPNLNLEMESVLFLPYNQSTGLIEKKFAQLT